MFSCPSVNNFPLRQSTQLLGLEKSVQLDGCLPSDCRAAGTYFDRRFAQTHGFRVPIVLEIPQRTRGDGHVFADSGPFGKSDRRPWWAVGNTVPWLSAPPEGSTRTTSSNSARLRKPRDVF